MQACNRGTPPPIWRRFRSSGTTRRKDLAKIALFRRHIGGTQADQDAVRKTRRKNTHKFSFVRMDVGNFLNNYLRASRAFSCIENASERACQSATRPTEHTLKLRCLIRLLGIFHELFACVSLAACLCCWLRRQGGRSEATGLAVQRDLARPLYSLTVIFALHNLKQITLNLHTVQVAQDVA